MYAGDFAVGATLDLFFTTRRFSTGAPFTLAGTPVISAYEDNSTTEITAGITLTADFDTRTGLNHVRVVASGANGFEAGKSYYLVITTGTVDSVSVVGEVIGVFTLERSALADASITAAKIAADAITAAKVADGTIDAATFAAGAINAAAIAADAITDAKVAADVTIASVTGAVGSVTGAVGSIGAGGIAAASFAAGAIDAAAIAASAIGASEIAADALTDAKFDSTGKLRSHFSGVLKLVIGVGSTTTAFVFSTVDGAAPSATNDFYKSRVIVFTSGVLAGQATSISAYTGATTTATVVATTSAPANGDVAVIV